MKKVISLILIILILVTSVSIVGCTGDKDETNSTTTAETNSTETILDDGYEDNLPDDINLDMIIKMAARGQDRFYDEFTVEKENAVDLVSSAVYARNLEVEERLGIELIIDLVDKETHGTIRNSLETSIAAGDNTYDIVTHSMFYSMGFAAKGYFYDLNELEYIDTTKDYWSQLYIEQATVSDHLYTITGEATLSALRGAFAIFVNTNVAEKYDISVNELYDNVNNKQWTMEMMNNLSENVYENLDGSEKPTVNDVYGYITNDSTCIDQFWSSFDIDILGHDSEGNYELVVDNEKLYSAYSDIYDLIYTNPGTYCYSYVSANSELTDMTIAFAENRALFMNNWLRIMEYQEMRQISGEYTVLPCPMYDENQETYYSYVHDGLTVFSIPFGVEEDRLQDLGMFLEAYASESRNTVIPAYYEDTLQVKFSSGENMALMLDYIRQGWNVNAGWMMNNTINKIPQLIRTQIQSGSKEIASVYTSNSYPIPLLLNSWENNFNYHD